MSDFPHCPICLFEGAQANYRRDGIDAVRTDCPRCGAFELSGTLAVLASAGDELQYGPRWLLSATIRNRYERGKKISLSTTTVSTLLELAQLPGDPFESVDLIVRHVFDKTEYPGVWAELSPNVDFPVVFARNPDEMWYCMTLAENMGMIEFDGAMSGTTCRLQAEGWRRLAELQRTGIKSDQAFVAMWFDDTMTPAYTDGIAPALTGAGYQPLHMAFQEHNEKIDDRIIAEIRRSGLLVADFTGHRGGVYFEAGFALGLGIPVIWTCREDEISQAHFDTRQYNYIGWMTPEDLKVKLTNRILATLPRSES